jgi:hypothetical protein
VYRSGSWGMGVLIHDDDYFASLGFRNCSSLNDAYVCHLVVVNALDVDGSVGCVDDTCVIAAYAAIASSVYERSLFAAFVRRCEVYNIGGVALSVLDAVKSDFVSLGSAGVGILVRLAHLGRE